MKTAIKTSLLIALTLTMGSAMAIPPPDKIIVCESNQKLYIKHWNKLNGQVHRQYWQCSQPYSSQACYGAATQSITSTQYRQRCPLKAAPAQIFKRELLNPAPRPSPTLEYESVNPDLRNE